MQQVLRIFLTSIFCLLWIFMALAQTGPWNNALRMAWSADGVTFGTSSVFQDSSGVPCVIQWKGDTLIATFQWFREPKPSVTWDRVAVKFSYDSGLTWSPPEPIIVNGLPANYQRPFDPTLVRLPGDSLRIYFSSSNGLPMFGLDSLVNTYSAISQDGIHYTFESGPRVDIKDRPVIDPAVIYFKNEWHYTAPIGSPQQGAYHFTSQNGIDFLQGASLPSDNFHNWTGNLLVDQEDELRFYGSGPMIWYNTSMDGNSWKGYVPTNIQGGDPAIVKTSSGQYLMVYVGPPPTTSTKEPLSRPIVRLFPNPAIDLLYLESDENVFDHYFIYNGTGDLVQQDNYTGGPIDISLCSNGYYFITLISKSGWIQGQQFIKMN